jgi:hypothetical protein
MTPFDNILLLGYIHVYDCDATKLHTQFTGKGC